MTDDIKARIAKLLGERPCWSWSDDRLNDWHDDLIERLAKGAEVFDDIERDGTCLCLGFQPASRRVTKEEVMECLRSDTWHSQRVKLAERIERCGIE